MVIDVKITGSSRPLGVNSPTVLGYLQHGQSVIREAQRSPDCRVGKATVVAYLIRRPPYRKYGGGWHGGAWAFLAFEVDRLLDWLLIGSYPAGGTIRRPHVAEGRAAKVQRPGGETGLGDQPTRGE